MELDEAKLRSLLDEAVPWLEQPNWRFFWRNPFYSGAPKKDFSQVNAAQQAGNLMLECFGRNDASGFVEDPRNGLGGTVAVTGL